ncbi:MAG TPA: protein kinase [Thermomicrobiales bacterium]|nr:protein kinase [Thermomicrobiales bacterium]
MQETVLNERYRLGEVVGEGGMAVVCRGHDLLLNRPVAIKILRAQYAADEGFLRRFEREAQAAAGFSHPNIVNVYDVGTDGDQHYIVMEYIRGPSLKDLIRRQGPFSVDGAIFVIGQVASALDYAHQRGLIHRDIKPQNILVDRDGNAKVVDFGIAKGMRDVNLTEAGTGMGTVHYVSPEQARGEPATPESDLYSTGVVLYEMLTKELPFEADTPVGVAMQHVNSPPPLPSGINPSIPPRVDDIVLKALAKEPSERYSSGAELAAALRHWDLPLRTRATAVAPGGLAGAPPDLPLPPDRKLPISGSAQVRPTAPLRPGQGRPRQRTGPMRVSPAPPRAARERGGYYVPPAARSNRDDLGCATWLIGAAILLGIVGLIFVAFRIGPDVFSAAAEPTATQSAGVFDPSPTVTPTLAPDEPAPTATAMLEATATVAASPTIEPSPTPTVEPSPTVEIAAVPGLVGGTLEQARNAVGDRWNLAVQEEFNQAAASTVISQQPSGGTPLADGETITLVVSRGPEFTSIPDVRGLPRDTAVSRLEAIGFVVTVVEEASNEFDEGLVIRTDPTAQARTGSTVTVYVSQAGVAIMPYVYSDDVDDAVEEIEEAGLTVGNVVGLSCERIRQETPDFDCDDFPNNAVVFSTVGWNTTVPEGTPVDIAYYDEDL